MDRMINTLVATFTLLAATGAQAHPMVDADAFVVGDHKAILDTTTNLLWLDFGINNGVSFNAVYADLQEAG